MPRCNEGNAFPDERRHDGDNELVNRVLVEEGPDDLTSAHHPDVLASLLAEAFGKDADRVRHELDAGRHGCRSRPPSQPIEIAIGSSDVAVRARRDIDDDFSPWHDVPLSVSGRLTGERSLY